MISEYVTWRLVCVGFESVQNGANILAPLNGKGDVLLTLTSPDAKLSMPLSCIYTLVQISWTPCENTI